MGTLDNLPKTLYKYRAWNEYTKQILTNHQLYFSNPDDFNDPYDCKPFVQESEFRIISNTTVFFHDTDGSVVKSPVEDGTMSIGYGLQKRLAQQLWSSFRICSFSIIFDSILMWSHYANYHKGICLVFDSSKDTDCFSTGCGIFYSNKRPTYAIGQTIGTANPVNTKFENWAYEQEFRLIKSQSECYKNNTSNLFAFKPEALSEIIFGAKAPRELFFEVKKICDENGLEHVKYSKMYLADLELYNLLKAPLKVE